jgi:hypothetical protein
MRVVVGLCQDETRTSEHISISSAEEGWTVANDNEMYLVAALTCNVLQQRWRCLSRDSASPAGLWPPIPCHSALSGCLFPNNGRPHPLEPRICQGYTPAVLATHSPRPFLAQTFSQSRADVPSSRRKREPAARHFLGLTEYVSIYTLDGHFFSHNMRAFHTQSKANFMTACTSRPCMISSRQPSMSDINTCAHSLQNLDAIACSSMLHHARCQRILMCSRYLCTNPSVQHKRPIVLRAERFCKDLP